jgi:hypothetical protein
MLRPATIVTTLIFAMLASCGPAKQAKDPSEAEAGKTESSEAAGESASGPAGKEEASGGEATEPAGEATAAADAPASSSSASTDLARDLLKSGGRKIAYSATKGFAFPIERRAGDQFSLDIYFFDLDGHQKDIMRVCQPGDCEEKLNELIKVILPKLASRLESDAYEAIRSIGWPVGRNELEVNSLQAKLRYAKGRLEVLREKKPAAALSQVGKRMDTPVVKAIFIVPGGKLLGVFGGQEGDEKGGQDFFIFKLPQ